mmetsp:Transcript_65735/g.144178  ORF Transcript_65735/g.144178 Transcript_65735/m.144178 type:complete len:281 (+) Transcript_65735:343-1185(+)
MFVTPKAMTCRFLRGSKTRNVQGSITHSFGVAHFWRVAGTESALHAVHTLPFLTGGSSMSAEVMILGAIRPAQLGPRAHDTVEDSVDLFGCQSRGADGVEHHRPHPEVQEDRSMSTMDLFGHVATHLVEIDQLKLERSLGCHGLLDVDVHICISLSLSFAIAPTDCLKVTSKLNSTTMTPALHSLQTHLHLLLKCLHAFAIHVLFYELFPWTVGKLQLGAVVVPGPNLCDESQLGIFPMSVSIGIDNLIDDIHGQITASPEEGCDEGHTDGAMAAWRFRQ